MTLHMNKTVVLAGDVAALVSFHMNGFIPFERTVEQITETMPLARKTITAANNEENYKLTRVATLLVLARL